MIIWSGRGILIPLILGLLVYLFGLLPESYSDYGFAFALLIAGIINWFLGKAWNEKGSKILVEKDTGKEFLIQPNHKFFFIKMEYWGIIFFILGCIALFQVIF